MTTPTRTDDSAAITSAVVAAAQAAARLLPAAGELVAAPPVLDPAAVQLPPGAQTAVVARLTGEVSGDVVVVVAADVVAALGNSPVGALELAPALRPALEAAAASLGRVRVDSERTEAAAAALDGLRDKGVFAAVPLLEDGAHRATFALQVTLPGPRTPQGSLEMFRNVPLELTVEIGRTRRTVAELLSLYPGEVVELDRAASSPADLLVNGTLIARGEVVVVDEDFGLRITEIVKPVDELSR